MVWTTGARLTPDALIGGVQRFTTADGVALHDTLLRRAHAYIDRIHSARCRDSTPKHFVRMSTSGIGNDLNQAVRSLALALAFGERQLVLLPPHPRNTASRMHHATDASHPWHWMPDTPLSAIVRLSSCQEYMQSRRFDAVLNRDERVCSAFRRMGSPHLATSCTETTASKWSEGFRAEHIPPVFRPLGLMWWFQALTTYLIRIRDPLRHDLLAHPALRELWNRLPQRAHVQSRGRQRPDGEAIACVAPSAAYCATRRCYPDGILPLAAFDVGLHMRLGDACRRARTSRTCLTNLDDALRILHDHGLRRGDLFLATDSEAIVAQAQAVSATSPFRIHYLNLSRARYDTAMPNELRSTNRTADLLDLLLEVLLLSRSSVIAGTMQSNVPRLALQWRVTLPGSRVLVSLDNREWCTRSSCRWNYTAMVDGTV